VDVNALRDVFDHLKQAAALGRGGMPPDVLSFSRRTAHKQPNCNIVAFFHDRFLALAGGSR